MLFEVRNRAYTDNNTSEVAGKFLPAHPTGRYKNFPNLWKKTRRTSGYIPRPTTCTTTEDELFPCCLSCTNTSPESLKEILARRSANAGWITADWSWDFGWTLPEGFVGLGVGVTPPIPPVERDRVFIFTPKLKRKYLEYTLQEHANLKGDLLHEARVKIITFAFSESVSFPGQIVATTLGRILIAVPRTILFGQGVSINERYNFEDIQFSPQPLPILVDGRDFTQEGDKIFLNGIPLN